MCLLCGRNGKNVQDADLIGKRESDLCSPPSNNQSAFSLGNQGPLSHQTCFIATKIHSASSIFSHPTKEKKIIISCKDNRMTSSKQFRESLSAVRPETDCS